MNPAKAEKYDLTRGERIRQGYFAALELVMRRFLGEMESYFFDSFKIHCQFDFLIQPNRQFRDYLAEIEQPCPIFLFQFSPLKTQALLVMENRVANLFLRKKELMARGQTMISKAFEVNEQNFGPLEDAALAMIQGLAKSWGKLEPAQAQLSQLVSHRVKAKVLPPTESVVIVNLLTNYKGLQTKWQFCFSAYELDPLLKKFGKKALLTGYAETAPNPAERAHLEERLQTCAPYQVKGILGEMTLAPAELHKAMEEGRPLPFVNNLQGNILVTLNGEPMLSAQVGDSHGHLALQVKGKYKESKQEAKKKPMPFKPISFPQA